MENVLLLSREEVAQRAEKLYRDRIRQEIEHEGNIGKFVTIDIATGEYGVDDTGLDAPKQLRAKNPHARLFGIRIGYKVAATIGGVMERITESM